MFKKNKWTKVSFTSIKLIYKKIITSSTSRVISGVVGGNLLTAFLAIIGSLIQARYVSPTDLGYFRSFAILSGYFFFLHLGLFDALQRHYPYYIGKGDKPKAISTAEICQTWNIGISAFVSIIFIVLAVIALVDNNWRAMLGWLSQAVVIIAAIYGGYLHTTYRSGHDFATSVKGSVFSSITSFLLTPFFLFWPYLTLALRTSVSSLISLVYLHLHRPLKIRLRFSWTEWCSLIKIGVPMFSASYGAGTLWTTIESTLVLHFLGTTNLGLWSISIMFLEIVNKIPYAFTSVYLPRVIENLGRTENTRESLLILTKPMIVGLLITLALIPICFVLLPIIINFFAPNYTGAIYPMQVMLFILPLIILEMPYSLLLAMGKVMQQNVSIYSGLIGFVILTLIILSLGYGLIGVIFASIFGRIIRILLTYGFIFRNLHYSNLNTQ